MADSQPIRWRLSGNGRYLPYLEIPENGTSLEGIERDLIETALKQAGGNQTRAARLLEISRDTLRYRIKKFDLEKKSTDMFRDGKPQADQDEPDTSAR